MVVIATVSWRVLAPYPRAFRLLTGLSPEGFLALCEEVRPAARALIANRLPSRPRLRAPGAGRPFSLCHNDQVLATLLRERFKAGHRVALMFKVCAATTDRAARRLLPLLLNSSVARVAVRLSLAERRSRFLHAVRYLPGDGGSVGWLGIACGILIDGGTVWIDGRPATAARLHAVAAA